MLALSETDKGLVYTQGHIVGVIIKINFTSWIRNFLKFTPNLDNASYLPKKKKNDSAYIILGMTLLFLTYTL